MIRRIFSPKSGLAGSRIISLVKNSRHIIIQFDAIIGSVRCNLGRAKSDILEIAQHRARMEKNFRGIHGGMGPSTCVGALDGRFAIYLSIAVLLFLSIMYYKLNKHTGVNVIYND